EPHRVGRRLLYRLAVAQRVLAARILVEQAIDHLLIQVVTRTRFVAINLAKDSLSLLLEILFAEERATRRIADREHGDAQVRTGRVREVVDDLFARRGV